MSTVLNDTLTESGTGYAFLESHTGETGATWTAYNGASGFSWSAVSKDYDELFSFATDLLTCYTASATPANADECLTAVVARYDSGSNHNDQMVYLWVRKSGQQDGYRLRLWDASAGNGGPKWSLHKVVSGTATALASDVAASLTNNTPVTVKLYAVGSRVVVTVDGTTIFDVTDTSITAAGKFAIGLGNWSTSGTARANGAHNILSVTGEDSATLPSAPVNISGSSSATATGSLSLTTSAQIAGNSSATATGTLALGTGGAAVLSPNASAAQATATLSLTAPAGLGSLASTATADGTLSLATTSAVGVRAAPGWLGLFTLDTGTPTIPTIDGSSTAAASGALSLVTPARALIAGTSKAVAIGSLTLRSSVATYIATPTSLSSAQFGGSALRSAQEGNSVLVPSEQHQIS